MAYPKFNFSYNLSEIQETIGFYNISSTFESGRKQVRNKGVKPRKWVLNFEKHNSTSNDATLIRQFFEARKGSFEPFHIDIKQDDGTIEEVLVRFAVDSLERTISYNTKYAFSLPVEEVL